jgi:hypothetical protein
VLLLVDHLPEPDGCVLDVAVLVLPSTHFRGEQSAPVHLLEIAEREFAPGLRLLRGLVVHSEMPVRVLIPAVGFDELVLLAGRWLVLTPVVPLVGYGIPLLDLISGQERSAPYPRMSARYVPRNLARRGAAI